MKYCKSCDSNKPVEDFNNCSARPDGKEFYCRECNKAKKTCRRYGITFERYDELRSKTNCAICDAEFSEESKMTRGVIDHNHETGEVRDAICQKCNITLGYIENNDIKIYLNYIKLHEDNF